MPKPDSQFHNPKMIHGIKHKNDRTDILKVIDNKSIWQPLEDVDLEKTESMLEMLKSNSTHMQNSTENTSKPIKFDEFERPIADVRILKNINTETYNATTQNPLEKVEEGENNLFTMSNQSLLFEKMKLKKNKQNKNVREKKRDAVDINELIHSTYFFCRRRKRMESKHYLYRISRRRVNSCVYKLEAVKICVEAYKETIANINGKQVKETSKVISELNKGGHTVKSNTRKNTKKEKLNNQGTSQIKEQILDSLLNDQENKLIRCTDIKDLDLPAWMQEK